MDYSEFNQYFTGYQPTTVASYWRTWDLFSRYCGLIQADPLSPSQSSIIGYLWQIYHQSGSPSHVRVKKSQLAAAMKHLPMKVRISFRALPFDVKALAKRENGRIRERPIVMN